MQCDANKGNKSSKGTYTDYKQIGNYKSNITTNGYKENETA